jgi:hypothetical protein
MVGFLSLCWDVPTPYSSPPLALFENTGDELFIFFGIMFGCK